MERDAEIWGRSVVKTGNPGEDRGREVVPAWTTGSLRGHCQSQTAPGDGRGVCIHVPIKEALDGTSMREQREMKEEPSRETNIAAHGKGRGPARLFVRWSPRKADSKFSRTMSSSDGKCSYGTSAN